MLKQRMALLFRTHLSAKCVGVGRQAAAKRRKKKKKSGGKHKRGTVAAKALQHRKWLGHHDGKPPALKR